MAGQSRNKSRLDNMKCLKGIESHNGFYGDEILLNLASDESLKATREKMINEDLRHFRDSYLKFAESFHKAKDKTKKANLLAEWSKIIVKFFGYQGFTETYLSLEGVTNCSGQIVFLKSLNHSIAVFFALDVDAPDNFSYSGHLTSPDGKITYESSRKESLSEQVEHFLKISGSEEALLILPSSLCHFNSESQTAGQCLEVRLDELSSGDHDDALSLAKYLLRSKYFEYSTSSTDEGEDQSTLQDAEATEDEDEDDLGGSNATIKVTESSLNRQKDFQNARKITEELHGQVTLALELLINARISVDPELSKFVKKKKQADLISQELFKDGLFVLYRILFVLYAEARGYLPVENRMFSSFYSFEHLREWAEAYLKRKKRGQVGGETTYLWGAMTSIFELLRRGVMLGGGEIVSPFNGQLFAPDRTVYFDKCPPIPDDKMAKVLTALTRIGGLESGRMLNFATLGIEQLGAVYEALLAQKPMIITEESLWVPSHGGGIALVTKSFSDDMELTQLGEKSKPKGGRGKRREVAAGGELSNLSKWLNPERPANELPLGRFVIAPQGTGKSQTASFYTPPKLAEFVAARTLKPLVNGKSSKEIRNIRLVEPAMGSGGFLIAAIRYLAKALLQAKIKEKTATADHSRRAESEELQRCKREIIENCIFGVDINPLAIELGRTSLYLEALVKGEPLPFLHHRLKSGNSLISADFRNKDRSQVSWGKEGTEFSTLFNLPFDLTKINSKLWDSLGHTLDSKNDLEVAQKHYTEKLASLKAERKKLSEDAWAQWAIESQIKVSSLLQKARKALEEFEKTQSSSIDVDGFDARHKDYLGHIPDMDQEIIKGYGIDIDEKMLKARKMALVKELGAKVYKVTVERQRAYHRLKALGDLSVSLWYWPLEAYKHYPSHAQFKEIVDYLLNEKTLNPNSKNSPLSKIAAQSLMTALRTARKLNAFHWDVEFAQVFGDLNRDAFDAVISNPPWKVVGVKDKDVYPEFDPQFMLTKANNKVARVKILYKSLPDASKSWYQKEFFTSQHTEHWRKGGLSPIAPTGKVDLSVLFTLMSENLLDKYGRTGIILSRSAIFTNKGTKALRERFFGEFGLEESISFVNTNKIFEIATYMEFIVLIASKSPSKVHSGKAEKAARFIHGVSDTNSLDIVSRNLDAKDLKPLEGSPYLPSEITLDMIRNYFSRDVLSIPGLTDPRQLQIAKALHAGRESGLVVYFSELEGNSRVGIDQTAGPKKGESKFAEDLRSHEKPDFSEVLKGKIGDWIPLYRGQHFNIGDPFYGMNDGKIDFNQYGKRSVIEEKGVDLTKPVLVWRAIGRSSDQRTLISAVIPAGVYADNRVFIHQSLDIGKTERIGLLLNSTTSDFLVRMIVSSDVGLGVIESVPLPNYDSTYLKKAHEIYIASTRLEKLKNQKSEQEARKQRAELDALVWLHYSLKAPAVIRYEAVEWVLQNQFDCLKRHDPEYMELVLQAYRRFEKEVPGRMSDEGKLFALKPGISLPKKKTAA